MLGLLSLLIVVLKRSEFACKFVIIVGSVEDSLIKRFASAVYPSFNLKYKFDSNQTNLVTILRSLK